MGQWVFQLQEANGFYEDFNYEEQAIEHETNGKIKGKQNEYSDNDIGGKRIGKINQFKEFESQRCLPNSGSEETPSLPF